MKMRVITGGLLTLALMATWPAGMVNPAHAQHGPEAPQTYDMGSHDKFSAQEIIDAGHKFFGTTTKGLARAVESAFRAHGRPTAYVLGEEGSGAFIAGLTYGEGWLYMRNGVRQKIFWQGPSIGFDAGGNGSKVLMLVYDLNTPRQIFGRFPGISGSAYVVAGFTLSAYGDENMVIMPIRSGIGARLGANMGYLKITPKPTWNPF